MDLAAETRALAGLLTSWEISVRASTAALQAAIDYCRTHSLTLWLPSGDYLISDTLVGKQTERLDAVDVSRHDIAAIWVAFFSRWQRYRC